MQIEDYGAVAECHHPTRGYFQWMDSFWGCAVSFEHSAFANVVVVVRCRAAKKQIPDVLFRATDTLKSGFHTWWPLVEQRVVKVFAKQGLGCSPDYKVKSMTINLIKETSVDIVKWNFELITEPYCVFNGRMEGCSLLKISRLLVY